MSRWGVVIVLAGFFLAGCPAKSPSDAGVDAGPEPELDAGACTSGCTLATGGCAPGDQLTACGSNGEACRACGADEQCTASGCARPQAVIAVGAPCGSDADCQAGLGAAALCRRMTSSGTDAYRDGYCTLRCPSSSCPSGSTCVSLDSSFGEADALCWDRCGTADSCRSPGYACYRAGGATACWISPLPGAQSDQPADKVGEPCTDDTLCQDPPSLGGVCLTRDLNREWVDGYCSKSFCVDDVECSSDGGARCAQFTFGNQGEARCVRRCGVGLVLDGGALDCRPGYRYVRNERVLDDGGVGPADDGSCLPPEAVAPTRTGLSCTTRAECVTPAGSVADCFSATLPDGGPTAYPGGYCSRVGCSLDEECAPDGSAVCLARPSDTACVRRCAIPGSGQNSCRPGYVCRPYQLGTGEVATDGYCGPRCDAPGELCPTGQSCDVATGACL